jgi:lysozyme
MTALEILLNLIKVSEGCKLNSYKDCVGIWTLGYGQTKGVKEGMVWTQQQADDDLLVTAMDVIAQALKASPVLVNATMQRQAAISDLVYNIGIGAYNKSTLKKYIDLGDFNSASMEILKWDRANGKRLKGLSIRRKKESVLLKG